MAEQEADEAGRLEAALERIARAVPAERVPPAETHVPPETRALADRLDALIAELRDILAQ